MSHRLHRIPLRPEQVGRCRRPEHQEPVLHHVNLDGRQRRALADRSSC